MRKIGFLLSLVLLCSCGQPHSEIEAERVLMEGMIPFSDAIHFEYHKHEYIKFYEVAGNSTNAGVVHDPDCKYCNRK